MLGIVNGGTEGGCKKATAESIALHLLYAPLEEATPKKTKCWSHRDLLVSPNVRLWSAVWQS